MNIKELKKIRMKTRNKVEKDTLMMLIDFTEKLAKEKNDADVDKYLPQAVKKYLKQLDEVPNPNETELKIVNDIANMVMPKTLNEVETKALINDILKGCDEISKKCFGKVMGELKVRNDVDMKLASDILKRVL